MNRVRDSIERATASVIVRTGRWNFSDAGIIKSMKTPMSRKIAYQEIKALCAACVGFTSEAEFEAAVPNWPELCAATLDDEHPVPGGAFKPNPLAGLRVGVIVTYANTTKTAANGQQFTNCTFVPVPQEG